MFHQQQKCKEEEKRTKLNSLKIDNQWRELFKLAKAKELKNQIQILKGTHERQLDRKNAAIQNFNIDLEQAEDQFNAAFQSHLMNIDALIELQNSRLCYLETDFKNEQDIIQSDFDNERYLFLS